jgi:hypothetical protein
MILFPYSAVGRPHIGQRTCCMMFQPDDCTFEGRRHGDADSCQNLARAAICNTKCFSRKE